MTELFLNNDHLPVIDSSIIENLKALESKDGSDNFVNELIALFIDAAPSVITSLTESLKTDDPTKIEHFSHKLKGLSRNLGASRLADLCEYIETHATNLPANAITGSLTEKIDCEYKLAKNQLESEWLKH